MLSSSLYDCVVCLKPTEVAPDGKIRIEGIVKGETEWLWGPYPVHEPCRLDIRTIYDRLLGDGVHVARGFRARADDPETAELLSEWARADPGTPAKHWPGQWSRRKPPLETPWPEFTYLADLSHAHLLGLVAKRGSREAPAGTAMAVHLAAAGKRVLLFTGYPPPLSRPTLVVDETPNPTPELVNQALASVRPDLLVIERWERMHPDQADGASRTNELENIGQVLKRTALRHKLPCIVTTSLLQDMDLGRPLTRWVGRDSPAAIMTEFCSPLLVLRRSSPAEVLVRLELHTTMTDSTVRAVAWRG